MWDDKGFLLSKSKYNENSLIVEIFTKDYGKIVGIIFGGTSKKIKNYLQVGNKLYVNYNSKSDSKIGYFKVEIDKPLSPFYFDNYQKLFCISSAMQLVRILTAESQKNLSIFSLLEDFNLLLKSEEWLKDYIFWELSLFKAIGYHLNFKDLVYEKIVGNKKKYFLKSLTQNRTIPNFLVDRDESHGDFNTLLSGLKLVSDYLEKSILKPNNLNQPLSRLQFINTLK